MVRSFLAAVAVAVSILLVGAPSDAETVSNIVHYGDLDLSSQAGRARLNTRIAGAIRQLCGAEDERNLVQAANVRHCRSSARSDVDVKLVGLIGTMRHQAVSGGRIALASR